ncbi:MAG: group III truncated hemoglobin [Pseudomonadota bacterium]
MSQAQPPRFDISRDDIIRVVERFYAEVRDHPMMGPVFSVHVQDWPSHERQEVTFWAKTILHEPGPSLNLAATHIAAGNVRPGMFAAWLSLFDRILAEELTADQATAWSALAHRIGRTLRASLVERDTLPGGVPKLT